LLVVIIAETPTYGHLWFCDDWWRSIHWKLLNYRLE